MVYFLVADIGGTNARFGLFDAVHDVDENGLPPLVESAIVPSADFPTFVEALDAALPDREHLAAACLAVAGPVRQGAAQLTNLSWGLDETSLSAELGTAVELINDVAAAAHGLRAVTEDELVCLQAGKPNNGPKALATLGTGLGMATLVPTGADWIALPSEGGHAGFAPRDAFEDELLRTLRAKHGRVSAERLASGSAMATVYTAVRAREGGSGQPEVEAAVAKDPWTAGAVIGAYADRCPICAATVDQVVSMFGGIAGDLVLTTLATGGLYVAGGIPGKLLPFFQKTGLLDAFNDKGRHRAVVESTPVNIVTTPDLGFRGAALRAVRLASKA